MIFYIGYYAEQNNPENRNVYLSATNKIRYIIDVLGKIDQKVQIVSCAMTKDKKSYAGSLKHLSPNVSLKYFKTFGRANIFTRFLDIFFSMIQKFIYFFNNVTSDDILLVYHSPAYCNLIKLVKRLKKCRLILEVEEIYADVSGDEKLRKKEISVCNAADAFVFPTELLNKSVNSSQKDYVIIHGTYGVEPDRNVSFEDDKIHVVYAGTFDPRKGGAAAAAAAEFLSKKYHIHILGFGTQKDTDYIKDVIEKTNAKSNATVTYDGLLSGEEYIEFLQKCHIGLSTQNPDADFNATSFPSKILSYMANGLRVVTVRIPAIEGSAVGNDLFYYEKQTPEEIAKAIMQVDLQDNYDSRKKIEKLDKQFCEDIKILCKTGELFK